DLPELNFLVEGYPDTSFIPKTLLYVDYRAKAQGIAIHLRQQLGKTPAVDGISAKEIESTIGVYSSIIPPPIRDHLFKRFRKGEVRILVCTDACGMGMDIHNVERVVQFGITESLTISDLVQRIGRCARGKDINGAAFIFIQEKYIYVDR
ncbi:hypothetical protein BJ508DRAFT_218046, partial [Ascobolus immersus RN42]